MVRQYPDILRIKTKSGSSFDESSGIFTEGEDVTNDYKCRAEPNSSGKYLSSADGHRVDFSFMIHFPKGTASIKPGSDAEIISFGESIYSSKIKRFHRGQLSSRAWV